MLLHNAQYSSTYRYEIWGATKSQRFWLVHSNFPLEASPFPKLLCFEGQRKQLHGGGESTTHRKEAAERS